MAISQPKCPPLCGHSGKFEIKPSAFAIHEADYGWKKLKSPSPARIVLEH